MKKILLTLIILGFAYTTAGATTVIKYNNTGTPLNAPSQFGSNASFTPENRARAGAINRQIKHENQYYNGLEKGNTVNVNINNDTESKKFVEKTKRTFAKDKFLKDKSKNSELDN